MRSRRHIVTGLAATVALAVLMAGLPIVLYRLGGAPWPRHLPSVHHIAAMLASRDDVGMLLGVIRDGTWLAWLLFSAAVVAEARVALRGNRSPRLRLGSLQAVAARLVALAALTVAAPPALTATASAATVGAQPGAALAAGEPAAAAAVGAPESASSGLRADSFLAAATATRLVAVRSGDCLWLIAQRYLGSGDRYPEIASLNYGRDMGDGLVFRNPSLIEPGWQLLVPGHVDEDGAQAGQSSAPSRMPAQSGSAATVSDSGPGRGVPSRHLGHPAGDHHYRRWHLAANEASGTLREAGAHSSAAQTVLPANQPADAGRTPAGGVPAGDELPALGMFAIGALAGSVLTSLNALRRRQRQERRADRRIALPAEREVRAAEQRLRAAVPAETPVTVRNALACLESAIIAAGQALPDIVGLHVTPDRLEVLLAAPAAESPPAPFSISPGRQGMCWQLAGPEVADQGGCDCHLLPGLITAGATADGYLLLDLESLQVTGCDGAPDLVDRVITTIATELATGRWAGWYELILVGCDELEAVGRAEHASSLEEALSLIEARRAVARRRTIGRPQADVRQLRLAEPDDEDWALTILVSRLEPSPGQLERLIDLAEESAGGVATLLAGDVETPAGRMAPTVLQLAPDPDEPAQVIANVVPLQITVRPRALSAADYDAVSTMFRVAADTSDVGQDDPAYAMCAAPPWRPPSADNSDDVMSADPRLRDQRPSDRRPWEQQDSYEQQPWEQQAWEPSAPLQPDTPGPHGQRAEPRHAAVSNVHVKVLGPFEISGAAEPLQPKQAELVLALALSGSAGLSNSALGTVLGADPDHPKPGDAVRQIIARARRRLGLASDGQECIQHAGNGTYVLHPDVSLDWTEFRMLAGRGDADALRSAVALIRGEPFTGSYFWWVDIPLLETVRAELVDAAVALAECELAAGSPRAAARAARAGLRAEVSAEQLWRVLMHAEYADGNLAGVGEAWRSCLDAIEDVSPGGEPHPDTEALYYQLTHAARQHAPARG